MTRTPPASTSSIPRTSTATAPPRRSSVRRSRRNRRRWILATKVGNPLTKKPHDGGLSRRWVLAACDDSLARLATDYIDIYYLHMDDRGHPDRGNGGRRGRPDQERQDPLFRRVELSRLADRRGRERMRGAGRAAAGRLPALLQSAEPDARGRDPARLRPLRHRRRAVFADRARRADGQVPARRRAGGFAGGAQGPANDGDGVPRGIARDRAEARGACREDRAHADAIRARVAVGEPDRHLGDRRSAHARAVAAITSARSGRNGATTTKRSSIRWSRPGIRRRPATPIRNIRSSGGSSPIERSETAL